MQHTLPVTWKLFRIANYLNMTGVVFIALQIIHLFTSYPPPSTVEEYVIFLLLITGAVLLLSNSIINLYLLEKCYPHKYPGKGFKIVSLIILILSTGILITLAFPFYYGFHATFIQKHTNDLLGYFVLLALATILITGFYTCVLQLILKKKIRQNYNLFMENFLNTDS